MLATGHVGVHLTWLRVDALEAIASRRSIGRLGPPGPTSEQLDKLLLAGASAPDHCELRPFRFVVLEGPAKDAFGEVLVAAYDARTAEPVPAKREKERTKLGRAPLVIVVGAARLEDEKVPWDEQLAAAAAACENILLAATGMGYGSMWRTGDPSYDPMVKKALGLDEHDAIVGFLYIGSALPGTPRPVRQPTTEGLVWHWAPPAGA